MILVMGTEIWVSEFQASPPVTSDPECFTNRRRRKVEAVKATKFNQNAKAKNPAMKRGEREEKHACSHKVL